MRILKHELRGVSVKLDGLNSAHRIMYIGVSANAARDEICFVANGSSAKQNLPVACLQALSLRKHNGVVAAIPDVNPHRGDGRLLQQIALANSQP